MLVFDQVNPTLDFSVACLELKMQQSERDRNLQIPESWIQTGRGFVIERWITLIFLQAKYPPSFPSFFELRLFPCLCSVLSSKAHVFPEVQSEYLKIN